MSENLLAAWTKTITGMCDLIDAGLLEVSDRAMAEITEMIFDDLGPDGHDLYCQLAARCPSGRSALKRVAQ